MTADLLRQARRAASRRAAHALGLTPKRIRAQLRMWGRRSPPVALQAAYWADLRRYWQVVRRTRQAPDVDLAALVRPHGRAVLRWNARKYETDLGRALGVATPFTAIRTDAIDPDLESAALESWTRENVALIQGATREQVDRITAAVLRAERAGTRAAELEAEISTILNAGARRARVIARDQILKFNGQLDRLKQTEAGIDGYIWRTSGDERVRPSHRDLNGRRFTWAKPPPEGAPGQPIQCRCQAEPDLTDLLGPDLAPPSEPPRTPEARANRPRRRRRAA